MFVIGFVMAAVLCCVIVFSTGRFVTGDEYKFLKQYKTSYGKYYDLMNFIENNALGDYSANNIDESIYRDIIASLDDPYAEYYTKEEYKNFIKKFSESYVGIGIVVSNSDNGVLINSLIKDAPAEDSGIKPGDILTKVDGKKVKDATDATNRIAGEAGTEVKVTVKRNDEEIEVAVNRAKITQPSVSYNKYDKKKKIGYICVSMFKEGTCQEFKNAVKDLKNDGYEKIIIDFRNNGGGSTVEAYDMADYLLPEGTIVSVVNKSSKKKVIKSDATSAGIDYVLLVNENTASASEIVACAIQDNNGGEIIGTKTYGKGVTQQTHELTDGSVVKITIEEYLRPNGEKVNGVGVVPDILIKNAMDDDKMFETAVKALGK